jgi:hypothetical protein
MFICLHCDLSDEMMGYDMSHYYAMIFKKNVIQLERCCAGGSEKRAELFVFP